MKLRPRFVTPSFFPLFRFPLSSLSLFLFLSHPFVLLPLVLQISRWKTVEQCFKSPDKKRFSLFPTFYLLSTFLLFSLFICVSSDNTKNLRIVLFLHPPSWYMYIKHLRKSWFALPILVPWIYEISYDLSAGNCIRTIRNRLISDADNERIYVFR